MVFLESILQIHAHGPFDSVSDLVTRNPVDSGAGKLNKIEYVYFTCLICTYFIAKIVLNSFDNNTFTRK